MNRPPQEADCRGRQGKGPDCKDTKCAFHMHQRFCGGDYVKVLPHSRCLLLTVVFHVPWSAILWVQLCSLSASTKLNFAMSFRSILLTVIIIAMLIQIAEPEGFKKKGSTRQPKRAFADGTALPVKRPRTSNTADPDAARSNKRSPAITDFFNSTAPQATNSGKRRASDTPGPQALVGAQDKRQDEHFQQNKVESGFVGSVHSSADNPAVLANAASPVDQSSVVQSHQRDKFSQPVKDADLSAERRRQLMADAATRRLLSQQHETASTDAQHGASGHSSRGSKPTVLPAHTGNLVPTGKGTSQPALHAEAPSGLDPKPGGGVAHVSAVIDLVDDDEDELQQAAQPKSNSYPSVCGSQQSSCPICGQMWGKTMSNVDISKHLDQCLCLQLL